MTIETTDIDIIAEGAVIRRPTLSLDVALYERFFTDSTLAEAEKRALLESLWAIIVGFVDLGFDVRPASEAGGQNRIQSENLTGLGFNLVELEPDLPRTQFEKAAEHRGDAPAETRE